MPVQRIPVPHESNASERSLPPSQPARPGPDAPAARRGTRTSAAWTGICVGALVLVALVVFIVQNTAPVQVAFLGMTGTAPLAAVLLIAGLAVGVVALAVGSLRIGQLRRRLRADRRTAL